jgi:hypothetical protein
LVVISSSLPFGSFGPSHYVPRRTQSLEKLITLVQATATEFGQLSDPAHKSIDNAFTLEGFPTPGGWKIPPLGQTPTGVSDAIQR